MENIYTSIFQIISSGALLIFVFIFYNLSRRLGEAMQMRSYYHLYTIGSVFILLSLLLQIYFIFDHFSVLGLLGSRFVFLEIIFLATGVTLSFIAALKYWGWLLKEIF